MTNETHDRNLAFDLFHESLFFELILFNDFDSNVFVSGNVSGMVDLSEIALSEEFTDLVFVEKDVPFVVSTARLNGRRGIHDDGGWNVGGSGRGRGRGRGRG